MIKLDFEKIYSTDGINENCYIGIPFKKGSLKDVSTVSITNEDNIEYASQSKATSLWDDGSVKWLFTDFEADILANKSATYFLHTNKAPSSFDGIEYKNQIINTGTLKAKLGKNNTLFEYVEFNNKKYENLVNLPVLTDKKNNVYTPEIENIETLDKGKLLTRLKVTGYHKLNNIKTYKFEIKLTFYRNKNSFELAYNLINTTNSPLKIKSLVASSELENNQNIVAHTGISNYKTRFTKSNGEEIFTYIDANLLKFESNEHNSEVFYGTFFGDLTNSEIGLSATVFQAHQNFPKAIKIKDTKMEVMIVPENIGNVKMESGMAREQKILYYFHTPCEDIQSINDKTIRYQMPNRPSVSPEVFKTSEVFLDVFTENKNFEIELFLTSKADEHARCYGMMSWGDAPDIGYTTQGRGNGALVWTNNEYDFSHSCALQYVRTGTRRYLDYLITSARHWIDVDVCHYSDDPLIMGGQYEHSHGHILSKSIVCSHQWVEGLLDYYHLTGDIDGYNTALGIGENVLRLLDTPKFNTPGETSARETGWALRTLTTLYLETYDEKWLEKCEWIVHHFKVWEEKYGLWLSPYTDNTAIRVVFMISVAVGSLIRYYRINPKEEIKNMILKAVKDLCDNARLDNGLFYYKELPSLKRLGNNPLILEALSIAYELSGDVEFIKAGIPTLKYVMSYKAAGISFSKRLEEDSLIQGQMGTKNFAQLMVPVTVFYVIASNLNLL